jgi:hypothetical protein
MDDYSRHENELKKLYQSQNLITSINYNEYQSQNLITNINYNEYLLPIEMIEEIYSHLGNTDKRRLRQTCKKFKVQLQQNQFENYFLEEYARDRYPIPQSYITFEYIKLFIATDHLEIIKQIKMSKMQQKNFCMYVAQYGKLDLLNYAYENHFAWDEDTTLNAASNGQLACLQYAHEHGCPWNTAICGFASLRGHLNCLQYAHEHGCPWDEWTCDSSHLHCLQYAIQHQCPGYEKYI